MKKYRPVYFIMFLLVVFAFRPQQCWSQCPPQPSGKYSIRHHRFEWTDTSRMEVLAADKTSCRIVVDVWYPAEKTNHTTAPYLDTFAIKRAPNGVQHAICKSPAEKITFNARTIVTR